MLCLDEPLIDPEKDPKSMPAPVAAAADRARAEAQEAADRRTTARFPKSLMPWLGFARLKHGAQVGIVDLSRGGALIESSTALKPGTVHSIEIAGGAKPVIARFGVLRSRIASLSPEKVVYHTACEFTEPLDLPELQAVPQETPVIEATAGADAPAAEAAPPAEAEGATTQAGDTMTLDAAADLITVDLTTADLTTVDLMTVDLTTTDPPPAVEEPVVASAADTPPVDALAAQAENAIEESPVRSGWQRIVARYMDGRTVKGFTNDFAVTRPSFGMRLSTDESGPITAVDLTDLKAVFFVRDFDGNPAHRERKTFAPNCLGKRLEVRFVDGESLVGTTPGYRTGGTGFFMTPADPRANNCRVFVVSTAVRNVRFL